MYVVVSRFVFFFFKQKTAYEMRISDWSSDVCSSDLPAARRGPPGSASAHRSPDPAADDRLRRPGDRSGRTIPADGGFQGASSRWHGGPAGVAGAAPRVAARAAAVRRPAGRGGGVGGGSGAAPGAFPPARLLAGGAAAPALRQEVPVRPNRRE